MVSVELVRAAVHQLHQREAAAAVQPHHVHPGAGGVPAGGHRVEVHRLWTGPAAHHRPHRQGQFSTAGLTKFCLSLFFVF